MIRSLHGVPQGYLFLYSFIWKTWMVEKTHTAVWDQQSMEGPLSWPVFDVNVECTAWGVHWSKPGLSVPFHPSKRLKSALFRDLFGKLACLRDCLVSLEVYILLSVFVCCLYLTPVVVSLPLFILLSV